MSKIDVVHWDRRIRDADRAMRRSPRRGEALEAFRDVATRSSASLAEDAKVPGEMVAWARYLTLERVLATSACAIRDAAAVQSVAVERPVPKKVSLRDVELALVKATAAAERQSWGDVLAVAGEQVAHVVRRHQELRTEAQRQLGWPSLQTEPAILLLSGVASASRQALGHWTDIFPALMAVEASDGWPVRISNRWARELFGRSALLTRLGGDLNLEDMPLGGASFRKALWKLGGEFAEVQPVRGGFWSLRRSPGRPDRLQWGEIFSRLLCQPRFIRDRLGLTGARLERHERAMAQADRVGWTLIQATMRTGLGRSPGDLAGVYCPAFHQSFGCDAPWSLAVTVPLWRDDWSEVVQGRLQGIALEGLLTETYDEDWYDNPRCVEALLAGDAPVLPAPDAASALGVAALTRQLQRWG